MRVSFIALAFAASVAAQTISPCILTCTTTAGPANGCPVITDVSCVCTNTKFQQAVAACITTTCPTELTNAMAVQAAQCGALGNSTTAANTASGTPTTTTSAPKPSGAASGLTIPAAFSAALAFVGAALAL